MSGPILWGAAHIVSAFLSLGIASVNLFTLVNGDTVNVESLKVLAACVFVGTCALRGLWLEYDR